MELVFEGRQHAEVTASAANSPEKIWIGVLTGLDFPSVHGYHACRQKVVTRASIFGHQQPFSAAERQACDPYGRAATRRRGQAEALSGLVQIAHEGAGLRANHELASVDFDSVHCGEIDHHPAVAHTESSAAVTSAADRQRQIVAPGKIERPSDIGSACA